ncbi:Eisosome component PIL1-domain-containing protein [Phaeosphaeria sp. MPI-PUGE-AT-0046c]|nr:Eisosome component PIL1-domain-containing protein [Phaeosphaeria sp. MPI-PUGE-AT-0046c]
MASLRGAQQPELSKRLYKIINGGEATGDETISEISDKLGVLLAEIAEQEDLYAQGLEEYRGVLKQIRNTEGSVQPSRDHKAKVSDEIAKLKYKEPQSTKIIQLEQELVRAEAQSLVAEAQLSNITRQKFKEAYDQNFAATIERAEKQIILAKHARRLLNLVDDTPIVPGDTHPAFSEIEAARQVLNDAESDLQSYRLDVEPVTSNAGHLGAGAMPGNIPAAANPAEQHSGIDQSVTSEEPPYSETSYSAAGAGPFEKQEPAQKEISTAV